MRKPLGIILALLLAINLCGCSVLQKLGFMNNDEDLSSASSLFIEEEEASLLTDKVPVYLYFANQDNTRLRRLMRYIPSEKTKKGAGELATALVEELIKGPAKSTGLNATIPEGSKLNSPVTVEKGTATVDFKNAFVKNHPGGKDAEQMTIYSIVNTLTELVEIQNVAFKIDGKESKEFKGNFRFDAAFPRTVSLISDEPAVKETLTGQEQPDGGLEEVTNIDEYEDIFMPVDDEPYIEILE